MKDNNDNNKKTEHSLINTVADNKSRYTNRDYSRAVLARKLQKTIGRPTTKTLIRIIKNKEIPNCPVTVEDIIAAEDIFGPDVGALKGKTTRHRSEQVRNHTYNIPIPIMDRYRDVTLCCDIMKINNIPFVVTISRHIQFGTIEFVTNMKAPTLTKSIQQIQSQYIKRGFRIRDAYMDGQFEPLRASLAEMKINLNTTLNDEHVPEIERYIRTVKERTRSQYCVLPFKYLPRRLVIELAYWSVFWLNAFVSKNGISQTRSPRAIVTGHEIDYKHCELEFGEYVQTHEEHDNSMSPRTIGALALRPTGNSQGGYYFLSLSSGQRINRKSWTALPMPDEVIKQVHRLARRNGSKDSLIFKDRNNHIIEDEYDDDDDDDESYNPMDDYESNEDDDDDDPDSESEDDDDDESDEGSATDESDEDDDNDNNDDDNAELENIDEGMAPEVTDDDQSQDNIEDTNEATETTGVDDEIPMGITGVDQPNQEEELQLEDTARNVNDQPSEPEDTAKNVNDQPSEPETIEEMHQRMDAKYGKRTDRYNLRQRKRRSYHHMHNMISHIDYTQYPLKRGLQIFGKDGEKAVEKEIEQLDYMDVPDPKHPSELTEQDRKRALRYLMFLKKKRSGKIKARGCADGRSQRSYIRKEDSRGPTVHTESMLISCAIDAKEGRDVATVDLPGFFMQTEQTGTEHVLLDGVMAEMLVKTNPKKYKKYLWYRGRVPMLYFKLKKALYGTLQGTKLAWQKLAAKFQEWGIELDPYDQCVANKTINGTQCTVLWHVDDIKISHKDPAIVTEIIDMLKAEYGKYADLTVVRGKVHDYLGMTLDFRENGKVKISMFKYIEELLLGLNEKMKGIAVTPAALHPVWSYRGLASSSAILIFSTSSFLLSSSFRSFLY